MTNQFKEIKVSDRLDSAVDASMGILRKERRKEKIRHAAVGLGGTALVLSAAFIFCINNTAFAKKLPIVGHIFEEMQEISSYPKGLSEHSVTLLGEEEAVAIEESAQGEEADGEEIKDSAFVKTSAGITIMVSEVTYDKNSIYMGVTLKSREPFPEGLKSSKYIEGYRLDYDRLGISGTAAMKDENGNIMEDMEEYCEAVSPTEIRGAYIDDYTFKGIMKADFSGIVEMEKMPDNFKYNLQIDQIYEGDCLNCNEEEWAFPDGEKTFLSNNGIIRCEGNWVFDFDIAYNAEAVKTVIVDGVNENGEGISTVSKSPYVVTVAPVIPEGRERWDYFCVVCDSKGDLLEYAGNNAESYDITGCDSSSFYVYVCDAVEYLDKLKGYFYSDDYEIKKKEKTFAQYLDEHCLYGTKVSFE